LRERQVAGPTLSGLRARLILLSAAGAAILLFSGVFGLGLLSADHPFWVNPANDMTIMLGGYEALLHAPWRFPPAVVTSLTGVPVSIVYTDSLPWLSLARIISCPWPRASARPCCLSYFSARTTGCGAVSQPSRC
jgi:hypothetical protein